MSAIRAAADRPEVTGAPASRRGGASAGRWVPRPWRGPSRRARWRRARVRRVLAAVLVVAGAWLLLGALLPQREPPGSLVVTVARDLPAGHRLATDDVLVSTLPEGAVPPGSFTDPAQARGRVLGSPVLAGEVLSRVRLHGPGLLQQLPEGLLMAHVPVPDRALAAVLQAGHRVDVLSSADGAVVGDRLLVLAVSSSDTGPQGWGTETASAPAGVYVAVTRAEAGRLATATRADLPGSGVTLALRSPPPD